MNIPIPGFAHRASRIKESSRLSPSLGHLTLHFITRSIRVPKVRSNSFESLRVRFSSTRFTPISALAEKGGSRTLRGPYGPQTGFEDQRHHRAPSFSDKKINNLGGHPGLFINLLVETRAGATSPQRLPRALHQCPRRPRSESRCMLQTAS